MSLGMPFAPQGPRPSHEIRRRGNRHLHPTMANVVKFKPRKTSSMMHWSFFLKKSCHPFLEKPSLSADAVVSKVRSFAGKSLTSTSQPCVTPPSPACHLSGSKRAPPRLPPTLLSTFTIFFPPPPTPLTPYPAPIPSPTPPFQTRRWQDGP